MSCRDSYDPRWLQKLQQKLNRQDSPLHKPVDLDSEDETPAPREIPIKDPNFGLDPIIKVFYQDGDSSPGQKDFRWVDIPPKQFSKKIPSYHDHVAIKLFKIKDRDKIGVNGCYSLKNYRVDVQNPDLLAALEPMIRKEGMHLVPQDAAVFFEPFCPLWFCQDKIRDLYRTTKRDDPLKPFLQLFVRVLDDLFQDLKAKTSTLLASGLTDFKTAWTLFPRNTSVYSHSLNSDFVSKVLETKYEETRLSNKGAKQLVISVKTMALSSHGFVWEQKSLVIPEFTGNKPIRDLRHYPFKMHIDHDSVMARLIARGKKVLDLQGLSYRTYNGIAVQPLPNGAEKHNVNGRILIDVLGYDKYKMGKGDREGGDPAGEWSTVFGRRSIGIRFRMALPAGCGSNDQQQRPSAEDQTKNKRGMLQKPDQLAFMSELIGGFALKNKEWVRFFVEDIEPVVWNHEAYSHLVFNEQQKDLVLSLVKNHHVTGGTSTAMEDVIAGKGQGLIVLLSGPPGTGKTLMAEAIADRTHRPLVYLQAEDLGTSAPTLAANLKRILELAMTWNAIILLDEADVFMAERQPTDIHRNELVSIFLRELEYYSGIIFLTTNMHHAIDGAFHSRVSMHLVFRSLGPQAREKVWRKFLERLPQQRSRATEVTGRTLAAEETPSSKENMDDANTATYVDGVDENRSRAGQEAPSEDADAKPLDDKDIAELASWELNGREIKTAIKTVYSWCSNKNYVMTLRRMENGIRVASPHARKADAVDGSLYD